LLGTNTCQNCQNEMFVPQHASNQDMTELGKESTKNASSWLLGTNICQNGQNESCLVHSMQPRHDWTGCRKHQECLELNTSNGVHRVTLEKNSRPRAKVQACLPIRTGFLCREELWWVGWFWYFAVLAVQIWNLRRFLGRFWLNQGSIHLLSSFWERISRTISRISLRDGLWSWKIPRIEKDTFEFK
jgi:hypothetical protein